MSSSIHKQHFGWLDGQGVSQFAIANNQGMSIKLTNYGATLMSCRLANTELVLGFDTLEEYMRAPFYFGCTVGRVANRIAKGCFKHDNNHYQLALNENGHTHLHGGNKGFDKVIWEAKPITDSRGQGVAFYHESVDGNEGYPGHLRVTVTYLLTDQNELLISFIANGDRPTPLNLTNHTYWNLAGAGVGNILQHDLQLHASRYLESDERLLPTGKILSVSRTEMDFLKGKKFSMNMPASGYDHCMVLDRGFPQAVVHEPQSGRRLEMTTTQSCMQLYTGNSLTKYPIANGLFTQQHGAFCLETQGFTDAVNHPHFPSIMLLPSETYTHETRLKISVS